MSHFLNSRLFGETNSVDKIYLFWKGSGLTDGLDKKLALQVSVALEIAALMLLADQKMCDMYYKMTGEIVDDEYDFHSVIFPIVRRVISGFNEAHEHVPEIINMAKKEFNSVLWRSLKSERESAIVYFYDVVLPNSGDEWHQNREHKTYYERRRYLYQKYLSRGGNRNYEDFVPIDIQAEFSAYVARKIENKLIEKYEKVN
jgi:hypothetical protein